MKRSQAGFTAVEAVIIAVIALALVGVGFWVFKEQSKNDDPSVGSGESIEAPSAPQVDTLQDITSAEQALDSINLEAGTSDNAELDTQGNGL